MGIGLLGMYVERKMEVKSKRVDMDKSWPVEKVLPLLGTPHKVKLGGYKVRVSCNRLLTYAHDGIKCKHCGIEGKFFALSGGGHKTTKGNVHLNLYGYNEYGHIVLLTSDHIIPKSKGGSNHYINRQCLCEKCNSMKGNKLNGDFLFVPPVFGVDRETLIL